MIGRLFVAMALVCALLIPWALGLSEEWSTKAIVSGLRATGFDDCHLVAPVRFIAGHHGYEVDFWCTPSILPICGIALLWFARQRAWVYLLTCTVFTVSAALLVFGNTVVSAHLRERGVDWVWAHYPGAILVYGGLLLGCIAYAEVRQRAVRRKRSRERTDSLTRVMA